MPEDSGSCVFVRPGPEPIATPLGGTLKPKSKTPPRSAGRRLRTSETSDQAEAEALPGCLSA